MTTANKITIVRILMIPAFVTMAIYYGQSIQNGTPAEWERFTAIAIFLIAALSDGLDGYVARRYNQRSSLGAWFPILVISRDAILFVGAGVLYLLIGKVHVKPNWTGKVATVLQMIAIGWVMLQLRLVPLLYVVVAAGVFTAVSGIIYVTDGVRQLQAAGHAHPSKS